MKLAHVASGQTETVTEQALAHAEMSSQPKHVPDIEDDVQDYLIAAMMAGRLCSEPNRLQSVLQFLKAKRLNSLSPPIEALARATSEKEKEEALGEFVVILGKSATKMVEKRFG